LSLLCILALAAGASGAEPGNSPTGGQIEGLEPFAADFFPILPWSKAAALAPADLDWAAGLGSIAECNFTISGFVQKADLAACEKLGLRAIVYPEQVVRGKDWAHMTAEEAERWAAGLVEGTAGNRAVLGYYLVDVEGDEEHAKTKWFHHDQEGNLKEGGA
jgi:hypothetical protein